MLNKNIIIVYQSSLNENLPNFLKKKNIIVKKLSVQNLANAKNVGLNLSKSKQ